MNYKIVVDSCGELPDEKKRDSHFETVPLTLMIDDYEVVDDDTFNQADFIKRVAACPNCPKSSCPSPERYMESYMGDYDCIFVVTLSEALSGSYNSAMLGKSLLEESGSKTRVHVFNSKSASVGETQIALEVERLAKAGYSFEEIVEKGEAFLNKMQTFFVLESLEALRKNGRLTGVQAMLANVLNIKPVMGAEEGVIIKLAQARGIQKALIRMTDIIKEAVKDPENKTLAISHCNCPVRAEEVKKMLLEKMKVRDVMIMDTAGVSTMYASDGGIIVTI